MTTVTEVIFGQEAHKQLLEGATILAMAVGATMGPSGHNVIIDNGISAPIITKDGVTVAKSINLKDKLPAIGAELLKEVAAKTNELAGDGTTSATVLAHSMLKEGIKMIATGRSPVAIKRGMDLATEEVLLWLKANAIDIRGKEDIINVGTISANGDRRIGELLSEAIERVGEDGIITVEPAKSFTTSLDVVEGMQFESGYTSPYFVTNQEKLTAELHDPFVLIANRKISSLQEILPVLELVANQSKPLLIIGDEIEGEVLHTLIVNRMKGVLACCAVKAPGYGENRMDILSDIALITSGQVIDASSPTAMKNIQLTQLGRCKKIVITRTTTTMVSNKRPELKQLVEERVAQLRTALADENTLDELQRSNYKKRLAKLAGGIAVIRVGGSTEVEILERKDRVEDALNATVAAVQEGIVPGGGVALFHAASAVDGLMSSLSADEDEQAGIKVVTMACREPLRVIVKNTGKSPDVVMNQLAVNSPRSLRYGYDARKHEYGDLVDKGIIDPNKVVRLAVSHAASVVSLILVCNAVVATERKDDTCR